MKIVKIITCIILTIVFLYLQNNTLKVTQIKFESKKLPESFNGMRIVHLSDLHGKTFGKDNILLVSRIKNAKPDTIIITGDLIDSIHYNEKIIIDFLNNIKEIAPVYYISGNHEVNSPQFCSLETTLITLGIRILRNEAIEIKLNDSKIILAGIDDPGNPYVFNNNTNRKILREELDAVIGKNNNSDFTILLSHRPEHFSLYAEFNIDLIFSGHAHGGQIRLPLIGGLIAPNQHFLPKYTNGKYSINNSTMIVSSGLGNGTLPQRIFNRPEIIVVTLFKK